MSEATVVTKKRRQPTETAAVEGASQAAADAPKATPPRGKVNLVERELEAVQFHVGVQLGTMIKTGFNAKHLADQMKASVELRLVGPGVWIRVGTKEYVVPYSNVLRVDLAREE